MDATKRKAWEEAGVPAALIDRYVQDNEATEKTAQASGITFKEADAAPVVAPVEAAPVETPVVEAARLLTIADLTPDAFVALMRQAQQPLADETATKEAATATALKAAQEQLTATVTRIGGLETELATAKSQVTQLAATVKELQGDVPAGVKRASQDATNIATKDQVEAFKGPAADPMNDFLSFIQTTKAS